MLRNIVKASLKIGGLEIIRTSRPKPPPIFYDQPEWVQSIVMSVQPYTMTSAARVISLCNAVEHVVRNAISGALVECGVWRGGSMMAAALALQHLGDTDRDLFLFDTFEGMPAPSEEDIRADDNKTAGEILQTSAPDSVMWANSSIEDVAASMALTGYPKSRIHFVPGMVEDTLMASAPRNIALLRLDTDWYASTKHELVTLYPRLTTNGVMIIDDYGNWRGSRKAVDEYVADNKLPIFLHRIDDTGRLVIKP
jgi:O-methyltransferase